RARLIWSIARCHRKVSAVPSEHSRGVFAVVSLGLLGRVRHCGGGLFARGARHVTLHSHRSPMAATDGAASASAQPVSVPARSLRGVLPWWKSVEQVYGLGPLG